MTDRELLQQALDALEAGLTINDRDSLRWTETIEALRARLAEQIIADEIKADKAVAWHEPGAFGNVTVHEKWARENGWLPLYTAPQKREWKYNPMTGEPMIDGWPLYSGLPKREWVGLTDEEAWEIYCDAKAQLDQGWLYNARAIEAKLKEKNQ